jgi:hypothetical protein
MWDAFGPKTFVTNLDVEGFGINPDAKGRAFFQQAIIALSCFRAAIGGLFSDIMPRDVKDHVPDPSYLERWVFQAQVSGTGFAIRLFVSAMLRSNDPTSMYLHIDFEDSFGWQNPQSERIVGTTMRLATEKLGVYWHHRFIQSGGQWRHGIIFP